MKKTSLILLFFLLLAGVLIADFEWNVESGTWNEPSNWKGGVKPNGTANINLRYSPASVCILNTDEGLFPNRLMIQNGQTWNIENGGRAGFTWARIGYGANAAVNMTGNAVYVLNNDDLYIGELNGNAVWTMYDTSSIVLADPSRNDDNVYVGKDGMGTLRIVGSKVTIAPARIDFGWIRTTDAKPVSTLEYIMDADGASTIVTQRINRLGDPGSTNHLVLSTTAPLPEKDIVLIMATGGYSTGGKGVFDTMNGGPAGEGAQIVLGGNLYALSYKYDANHDSQNNDIALVFIRSAKHMASSPIPPHGAVLTSSPVELSWTLPDPNDGVSSITCYVCLGMELPDPNRTNMDCVMLPPNVSTVAVDSVNFHRYGIQPLPDSNDFYWIVDCFDSSPAVSPEEGKGIVWKFTTDYNNAPSVDAGPDQVAWLGKSGTSGQEVITLAGTYSDDEKPNPPGTCTLQWTQVSGPADAAIVPDNDKTAAVTITTAGVYQFMLTADDGEKQGSDTVQVIVGSDSCHASYLNGTNYNSKDFNLDCTVDLIDFADFAADWLACTNTFEGC